MEHFIKITSICLFLLCPTNSHAFHLPEKWAPADEATLELLIDAHKKITKYEKIAAIDLESTQESHVKTTDNAEKYRKARDYLNQRLSDVNSIFILTALVFQVGLDLEELIEDYVEFSSLTFDNVDDHPFLAVYFASINNKIWAEVQNIRSRIEQFTLFQTNVFKATMKEKKQILTFISNSIKGVDHIIWRAKLRCRSIMATGVKEGHILDLLNDKDNKKSIDKLVNKWNKDNSKTDAG